MRALTLACAIFLAGCSGTHSLFSGESLPEPTVRTPYTHDLSHNDRAIFSVSAGRLPFGLQLEPDGRLHCVPIAVQRADFTVTATRGGKTESKEVSWTVADAEGMRLLVEELPVGVPGQAYSHQLSAVGGTPTDWRIVRAAVLGTDAAAADVAIPLEGLRTLRDITGVPGLPGRALEHRENIDGACGDWHLDPAENGDHHQGTGQYADYRYWTETSRDQFTGNIWGHAVVYEVLPSRAELRALAAENIVALAAHVWDNEMKIVDTDGLATNYGILSGYGFDGLDPYEMGTRLDNGVNAAMLLNWFQLASQVAQDEETRQAFAERLHDLISDRRNPAEGRDFEHSYLDLLDKNYSYCDYPAGADYYNDMRWYNVHMAFSTYFHLIRRAEDPELRRRALEVARTVLWEDAEAMASGCEKPDKRRARREWNPHHSWQYLAALGDRDAESIFECLTMLMWFADPPRRDYRVDNPLGVETVPGHPDWACEPVPIHLRPPSSNYLWHREPYRHTGGLDTPGREDGGGDGFVPYWMGRYFGFVPSNI